MVVASVLVVMYNTDVPLKVLRFLLRKRRTLTGHLQDRALLS